MKRIGIAVPGLGWTGQAQGRSVLRIASLFPDRAFQPEIVVSLQQALVTSWGSRRWEPVLDLARVAP